MCIDSGRFTDAASLWLSLRLICIPRDAHACGHGFGDGVLTVRRYTDLPVCKSAWVGNNLWLIICCIYLLAFSTRLHDLHIDWVEMQVEHRKSFMCLNLQKHECLVAAWTGLGCTARGLVNNSVVSHCSKNSKTSLTSRELWEGNEQRKKSTQQEPEKPHFQIINIVFQRNPNTHSGLGGAGEGGQVDYLSQTFAPTDLSTCERNGERKCGLGYIKTESWMKHYLYGVVTARTGTGALAKAKKTSSALSLSFSFRLFVCFHLKASWLLRELANVDTESHNVLFSLPLPSQNQTLL